MNLKHVLLPALCILALFAWGGPLFAVEAEQTSETEKKGHSVSRDDKWHFIIAPYMILPSIRGTVGVDYKSARPNLSYSDVAKETDATASAIFSMLKGKHSLTIDFMYAKLHSDSMLRKEPVQVDIDITTEITRIEAHYGYRFFENRRIFLDAQAGLRYWHFNMQFNLVRPTTGYVQRYSDSDNWIDPIIGLKVSPRLTETLSMVFKADIGGFNVGSRLTSRGRAGLNYSPFQHFVVEGGYEYSYVDYEKGGSIYDMTLNGPYFGFGFIF